MKIKPTELTKLREYFDASGVSYEAVYWEDNRYNLLHINSHGVGGGGMTIRYEENMIYTAQCNICGSLYTTKKKSLTEMELFMKTNGWEIWKSDNAHQPDCVCYHCKSMVESQIKK